MGLYLGLENTTFGSIKGKCIGSGEARVTLVCNSIALHSIIAPVHHIVNRAYPENFISYYEKLIGRSFGFFFAEPVSLPSFFRFFFTGVPEPVGCE